MTIQMQNKIYQSTKNQKLVTVRNEPVTEVQYVFLKDGKMFGPSRYMSLAKFSAGYTEVAR